MICYVDANFARNILNMQYNSGILIYVNNTPVIWYYKMQNIVELSSLSYEFAALRIDTKLVKKFNV